MYRLLLLLVCLLLTLPAEAQVRYDTLFTRPVGPGMVHSHIVEHDVPWNLNVLEIDLENPYLEIRAMLGNDQLGNFERIVDMARRVDQEGARVVGAINADFFAGARPVSMHIGDGQVARRETTNRPGIAFDSENRAAILIPTFTASVTVDGEVLPIAAVNEARGANQIVLYNRHIGTSTGTSSAGTEVIVRVANGWSVNDTLSVVVEEVQTGVGDAPITEETAVLSASGSAADALAEVSEGDTLRLFVGTQAGPTDLQQMVSGQPYIVVDGEIDVGPRGDGVDRHPRTAVGLNADSTRFYMVTVDGRQAISAGMDLYELADFMVRIGVHTAINLDGGGSTTLVVRNEMANRSSDGGNGRAVTNGLLAISTAPEGELSSIRLPFETVRIFRGESRHFEVEGIDEFYNPVPYDTSALVFEVDEKIGTIDEGGLLVTNTAPDTGFVYVRYGELADTMRVIVKDVAHVTISPREAVTDTSRTLTFRVASRDSDNIAQSVPASEFDWSVSDPAIGEITSEGVFRGYQPGSTDVIVSYGTASDTARVTIEVGEGEVVLETFEDLERWTVETVNMREGTELQLIESDERASVLEVNYDFLYGEGGTTHQVLLHTDELLYGVPDTMRLDVLSDGRRHRVFFVFEDNAGEQFQVYIPQFITESEHFERLAARIDRAGMVHPIRLRTLGIMLGTDNVPGQPDQGSILLDSLTISYAERSAVSSERVDELPDQYVLHQNYPNPFNPSTTIRYELPAAAHVTLRVYNVLGQLVETIVDSERVAGAHSVTWDATPGVASGIYFYTLEADGHRTTRSMMLLK